MIASQPSHPMRINERLLEYWRSLKPENGLPQEAAIDPAQLNDIWDSCFLVKVGEGNPREYTYVVLGKALVDAYGDDWTGKTVCEALLYPHPEPMFKAFESVLQSKEPFSEDNEFTNPAGLMVKYRSCLLPLARSQDGSVAYIIGGMKWKAY